MSLDECDDGSVAITSVCTMGTPECDDELQLFLRCLRVLHPDIHVLVGCTSTMITRGTSGSRAYAEFGSDALVEWIPCLDCYTPVKRSVMERQRGVWYPSRHTDFMMEKANLMERAMMRHNPLRPNQGVGTAVVAFLDCDVFLLGQLPRIPRGAEVALSPHRLRHGDEALFGKYNGGFVVATNPLVLHEWRRASQYSRYFDQSSLEDVARRFSSTLYELQPQHNYGYWRFFQSNRDNPLLEAKEFSIKPAGTPRQWTLCYEDAPLRSIHTHLLSPTCSQGRDVQAFNTLIKMWILKCIRPQRLGATHAVAAIAVGHNRVYEKGIGTFLLARCG